MLRIGDKEITAAYLGGQKIVRAYLGEAVVFDSAEPPVPAYTVTTAIDPTGSGTAAGAGTYQQGASVTVTATPAAGYKFVGWRKQVSPGESRLPAGYTELEYIQSTGTQYINTEVIPTDAIQIDLDFVLNSDGGVNNVVMGGAWDTLDPLAIAFNNGLNYYIKGASVIASLNLTGHNFMSCRTTKLAINGTSYTLTGTGNLTKSPIYLYWASSNIYPDNKGKYSLYSCQIYDGAALVRDLVPCKDSSGNIGLYDAVNSKFYGNAGTGTFIAGPESNPGGNAVVSTNASYTFTVTGDTSLTAVFEVEKTSRLPAGYTEVQYIQNANTSSYINTGKGLNNSTFTIEISAPQWASSSTQKYLFSSGGYFDLIAKSSSLSLTSGSPPKTYSIGTMSTGKMVITGSAKTFTVNGKSTTLSANNYATGMTFPYRTAANCLIIRLYLVKGTKTSSTSKTYNFELIPCINPSGVAGLYDLTNSEFIAPTAGTFIAGPAV